VGARTRGKPGGLRTVRDVHLLETDRLTLSPWRVEHVELLARLAAIPEVMTYIGPGTLWSQEKAKEISNAAVSHWVEHSFGWRTATERASGRLVGFLGLNFAGEGTARVRANEYEIGWWMDPMVWGRGYAREGGRAIRDEALQSLHAPSVIARIQPANARSVTVAKSLGLTHEFDTTGKTNEPVSVYRLVASDLAQAHR
jgi:RimJ/RimL family protein N-acetyltransferase